MTSKGHPLAHRELELDPEGKTLESVVSVSPIGGKTKSFLPLAEIWAECWKL